MYHSRKVNFISSPCTEAASDIHLEEAIRYTQFWFPNNLKTDILPWPPLCNGAKNAGDCENVLESLHVAHGSFISAHIVLRIATFSL